MKNAVRLVAVALLAYAIWQDYGHILPLPGGDVASVLIVTESEDRTPAEASLLVEIRRYADEEGLPLFILDPDSNWPQISEYLQAGQDLPAVWVLGEGGRVLNEAALPDSLEGFRRLVE